VELKLPTVAVPVRMSMAGGALIEGEVFVADLPRNRHQLLDAVGVMLEQDEAFVPVRSAAGVELVAKHAITWLSVARAPDLEEVAIYDHEHRVEFALVAGESLRGTVFDMAPAERPRIIDHLNRAGRFVRLWTAAAHLLVNKSQIIRVRELR
jgi:hypothetical protein